MNKFQLNFLVALSLAPVVIAVYVFAFGMGMVKSLLPFFVMGGVYYAFLLFLLIRVWFNKKCRVEERAVWFLLIFLAAPVTAPMYLLMKEK